MRDLALIRQWVSEVVSPGPDFIPCMLTVTGQASAWRVQFHNGFTQMLNTSCPTQGTYSDWSCSWPCCHPERQSGDLEHTTHSMATGMQLAEVRWGSRNKLPRPGGWQEISDQLSCSFTTHWLQWQNHPAGFFLQPQHFCPVLKSTTPFCRHNCFPVCSVSSIMENGSIWDDIFSGAF